MQIRMGQDFAAGILFAAVGLGAFWIGADYSMGTPARPGTGVLPRILAWCLIGTGGLLIAKALLTGDQRMGRWAWRPLIAVTAATIVFGMAVDSLGLVVATSAALTICALGTKETRWPEFFLFLVMMLAIAAGLFVWLLGMPIPIWPVRVPDWVTFFNR